jgi:hypothetical protein
LGENDLTATGQKLTLYVVMGVPINSGMNADGEERQGFDSFWMLASVQQSEQSSRAVPDQVKGAIARFKIVV